MTTVAATSGLVFPGVVPSASYAQGRPQRYEIDPGGEIQRPIDTEIIRLSPNTATYDQDIRSAMVSALTSMAAEGKRLGRPVSSNLLQTYLNNRNPGAVRTVSGRWVFSLPTAWTKGLDKNLDRYEKLIDNAGKRLKPGESTRIATHYDAQILSGDYKKAYPGSDHYTALGSFTVHSDANLVVSKDANGRVTVSGSVKHGVIDRYDFDRNAVSVYEYATNRRYEFAVRDFKRLEDLGLATPFDVRSGAVVSTPTVDRNGRVQWQTVDENKKPMTPPSDAPRGRPGGGVSG